MITNDFDVAQHALDMVKRGDMDSALSYLMSVIMNCCIDKSLIGKALFVHNIDNVVAEIGKSITFNKNSKNNEVRNNIIVHIATEVYSTGGHTRIIEDIAGIFPESQHFLILTDLRGYCQAGRVNINGLNKRFSDKKLNVIFLGGGTLIERIIRLRDIISDLNPKTINLMAHQFDVVTYAAVDGSLAPSVLFFHHADHQISIGATRKDYVHVDFGPACYHACSKNHFHDQIMLGMTVPDSKVLKKEKNNENLIGVTSGNWHKFVGENVFTYSELLISLMKGGVERFYHVGSVPDDQVSSIRSKIQEAGGIPDWIIFLGEVQSLQNTIRELQPDFYMNSHPTGGGRATVEAMSLGLPILDPVPVGINRLIHDDMTLGSAIRIMDLSDVERTIIRIKEDKDYISLGIRSIYEANYTNQSCIKKIGKYFL